MRNFIFLSVLVFILGLIFTFRIQNVSNQNSTLPEFGPIILEKRLGETPRLSEEFQIIKVDDLIVFADTYPKYQAGDLLSITGDVNDEGLIFRPKIEKLGREESVITRLGDLRLLISRRIDRFLPSREATLVKGMVLGVDEIDKRFREQLIATGTIHAVVVSGQNLSIVAGFFLVLVRFIGRRLSMFLSITAVIFYAVLTGFEVPVVRALIMVILSYCAVFLGRERLAIWYLLLSAAIIIFVWPKAIFDISFQLTFAATLGIMTMGQKLIQISNYKKESLFLINQKDPVVKLVFGNAAVAISAYLFTAPLIFWHFGRLSLIAPLVNILVSEAIVPIMVLGFMVAITALVFTPIAQVLAYLVYVPALYFVQVVEIFGK